jgi:hypothetical protein
MNKNVINHVIDNGDIDEDVRINKINDKDKYIDIDRGVDKDIIIIDRHIDKNIVIDKDVVIDNEMGRDIDIDKSIVIDREIDKRINLTTPTAKVMVSIYLSIYEFIYLSI